VRIKAIIFDVDGTLADTEEAHREAFHSAFAEHHLDWHWSTSDYARRLAVTGGKERLAAFVESLPLSSEERAALNARIPAIHRTKSDHYTRLVRMGRVPLRAGIKRLLKEAESAGVTLAIASTTTRENIDALLGAHFGEGATGRFSVIGAGDAVAQTSIGSCSASWANRPRTASPSRTRCRDLPPRNVQDSSPWSHRATGPAGRISPGRICY
jgi:phosphoglycolate phosphatase-like HAD superfamily hydrolase